MIPTLGGTFNCLTGLSDHSMGSAVAVGAVPLGIKMVEKHLTLRRADGDDISSCYLNIPQSNGVPLAIS